MIKGVAVGFLNNNLCLHTSQVGNLLDELLVVAGKNSCKPGLHRCRGARGHDCTVAFGQLQQFCDALSSGDF